MKSVYDWSSDEVGQWLENEGFKDYVRLFRDQHKIDGKCLLILTEDDLRHPPLQLTVLGDIKRISLAIRNLRKDHPKDQFKDHFKDFNDHSKNHSKNHSSQVTNISSHNNTNNLINSNHCDKFTRTNLGPNGIRSKNNLLNYNDEDDDYEDYQSDDESEESDEENERSIMIKNKNNNHLTYSNHSKKEMKPEAWKALVAMIYFFTATWITAIVMVIVHDRVPDMQTYPPLPDIFLDNIPLIPWAFNMCEICGLTLFIIWLVTLVFHKHRFILLRRTFSLFGSVFFLRCVTMLITSLSVPGRHLQCKARPYGSWQERLHQAFLIWLGGGMSIQGVRSCGDYMFSGHTVVLTLLNFFITEYTPIKLYYLHTVSWVLNLFGIFFILAAHEHYSIDVFIAFYISTRLFLYYHTLANNRALYKGDCKRTRIWFPLFYFFESGVKGRVPNELESPFHLPNWNIINFLTKTFNKFKRE